MIVLGLDFGGTKVAAGIVDLEARRLVAAAQAPTPPDAAAALTAALTLSRSLPGIDAITGIGVSFGGHVRANHILRSVQVAGWEDFPLDVRLREQFGLLPVRIANDANGVALAEWRFGAARDVHSFLYVTVSTGIGGGVVIDGSLFEGKNGMAGEIGHVIVEPEGPLCGCGKRGCLEALAAGPAIARRAAQLLAQPPDTSGGQALVLTAKAVAQLAAAGNEPARQALIEAATYLGRALGNALDVLDLDCVVLGGGVTRSGDLWWQHVRAAARAAALVWDAPPDLRCSALGDYEGIWGAAALIMDELAGVRA